MIAQIIQIVSQFPWEQILVRDKRPGPQRAPRNPSMDLDWATAERVKAQARVLAQRITAGDITREQALTELSTSIQDVAPMPSTGETVAELRGQLVKELYRMELDLTRGGRIAGKPCDCLVKHGLMGLPAITEELVPMDPDPLYGEIISWSQEHAPEFNPVNIPQYSPEHYRALAGHVRDFRKRLTETPSREALTTPN